MPAKGRTNFVVNKERDDSNVAGLQALEAQAKADVRSLLDLEHEMVGAPPLGGIKQAIETKLVSLEVELTICERQLEEPDDETGWRRLYPERFASLDLWAKMPIILAAEAGDERFASQLETYKSAEVDALADCQREWRKAMQDREGRVSRAYEMLTEFETDVYHRDTLLADDSVAFYYEHAAKPEPAPEPKPGAVVQAPLKNESRSPGAKVIATFNNTLLRMGLSVPTELTIGQLDSSGTLGVSFKAKDGYWVGPVDLNRTDLQQMLQAKLS